MFAQFRPDGKRVLSIVKGLFETTTISHDRVHASVLAENENILALLQK